MVQARLETALAEAGGAAAPDRFAAQLRALLIEELAHGTDELHRSRSGYGHPVVVAIAVRSATLVAVAPIAAGLRADPGVAGERGWLLVAALTGALVEATRDAHQALAPALMVG